MNFAKILHRGNTVHQKGFTLVELMITLVIVAIGVALAVPTYDDITQRRQTTAQAEELASWLEMARSEAVKSNREVSVQLSYTSATNWCIGANEGTGGCDCTETNTSAPSFCSLNGVPHRMDNTGATKSGMSSYSVDTTFVYDPIRGIKGDGDLSNHAYTLESSNGHWSLQVDVGPTGKVQVCNPDGAKKVPGFDLCTQVSVPPIVVITDPIVTDPVISDPIVITDEETDPIIPIIDGGG